ncbi:conjugal transfer protein TraY (plasmid) [Candidatus Williamhamiltonella defendens]|uniref:Conjugal transfer protein TraY n=1 Tax=Candidatus Williamhamiltonella defendens TaxID=138072 RepID=A0AAC9VL71_9ENTR|nr:DotA/TraY family protein [Candidatus Hamiltonella defensa]ASV34554.1 conjugal transfer protein TraY [Candidatus Hamiltonella defensa]AWK17513.1 conjugal transfer protein TraY [Candidatus Hamiltonella defensa]
MKKVLRLVGVLALIVCSPQIFAEEVNFQHLSDAAKRSGDLSRQMLVMIFGDIVNNPLHPTHTTMIGELFFVFNSLIATIALFWFITVTLRQMVQAGHQGQVFRSGRSPLYPVTVLLGFLSLVPTSSGWSLSQLIVLWAASIMGVGSANLLTDKAAALLQGGHSLVMQPIAPQTLTSARAIFEMNLCLYGINEELRTMYSDSGPAKGTPYMSVNTIPEGFMIGNGSAQCGSARLPVTQKNTHWTPLFSVPVNTEPLIMAQTKALHRMQTQLSKAAHQFALQFKAKLNTGTGTIEDVESQIQKAAREYEDNIKQEVRAMNHETQLQDVVAAQLRQYGWLALGSWYQTFATANNKTNAVVNTRPTVTGRSQLGETGVGAYHEKLAVAYRAQIQNSTYTAPLGTQSSKDSQKVSDSADPTSVLIGISNSLGENIINKAVNIDFYTKNNQSNQINPLLKMKAIGDYTLGGAASIFGAYISAKLFTAWGKGNLAGNFINTITGAGEVADSLLQAIGPVVYFLVFILLSIGFSLSVYLPFIPFIYWISASTNWIVGVLIGATAGSLWAATHLGGEGDRGSRSAYGYVFLIDVMLRPMLMVFGFLFASLVVVAVGTLLNTLFASALANVQADSITGLISIVGVLMIYARICTTLVSSAFSLQVSMPDYVISWLGGREGANMLGGMNESIKGMFANFGSGTKTAPSPKKIVPQSGANNQEDGFK